jgi:hypothetical protein
MTARLLHERRCVWAPNVSSIEKRWVLAALWLTRLVLYPYVLYLVLGNVALTSACLARVFEGTNDADVGAEGAYTLFPFFVHVGKLRINVQDQNVQARIIVYDLSGWLDLSGVFHRKFRATHVRGDHAEVRVRLRQDPWDIREGLEAAMAPIPPNSDPPIRPAWVPNPPILDWSHSHYYEVEVDDVDVGVHEAWIQELRYQATEGDSRARGSFDLKAGYELWVGPATLQLAPGILSITEQPLLRSLEGTVALTIEPFLVDDADGMNVLRWFDLDASVRAQVCSLEALAYELPRAWQPKDGAGQVSVDLHAIEGVFQSGSVVEYESDRAVVRHEDLELRAPLRVLAHAHETPDGPLEVALTATLARLSDDEGALGVVEGGHVSARLASLDIVNPPRLVGVVATVSSARVPSVARLNRYSRPEGMELISGSAEASGTFGWHEGIIDGNGNVSVRDMSVGRGDTLYRGTDQTEVSLVDRQGAISGSVHTEGNVSMESARLRAAADLVMDLSTRDFRPGELTGEARARLTSKRARVGKTTTSYVGLEDASLTIEGDRPRLGRSTLDVAARTRELSHRHGSIRERARLDAHIALAGDASEVAGPMSLSIRDGMVSGGERGVSGWWGNVTSSLRVRWRGPVLTARARLRLRDAGPLTATLAMDGDIPDWLVAPTSGSEVKAEATTQLARSGIALAVLDAREGALELRGRLRDEGNSVSGAFLIGLHAVPAISAGVLLDGAKAHVSPLVGTTWLKNHGGDASCAEPWGC